MAEQMPLPDVEPDGAMGERDRRPALVGGYRGDPAHIAALQAVVAVINFLRLGMLVPVGRNAGMVTAVTLMGGVTLMRIGSGGHRCVMVLRHRRQHERGMHSRPAKEKGGCQQPYEKAADGHQ